MSKNLITKHQKLQAAPLNSRESPYRLYGLRDNPFPSMGLFVASADNDPRQNGEIYDDAFRRAEEEDFFHKFVLPQTGGDPVRLGFLRLDPFAGGRGNGKSTFLNRIMHRINEQEWEDWASGGDAPELSALAVHILPKPREQSNVFALIKLMFVTMSDRGLLKKVDRDLRASVLLTLLSEEDIETMALMPEEEVLADLGSPERFNGILERHGLDHDAFMKAVKEKLEAVSPSCANNALVREFLGSGASLVGLWTKWQENGVLASDHRWRKYGTEWLVDGLVPVLMVAGYRRLFVLLDEFEKIYMYQSSAKRDEFLDVLRQTFYERDSAAVRYAYVSTVLTIHPSIYEYLSENWKRVGLDGLAPLDLARIPHYSVELGASDANKLDHLLMTYLDAFRTSDAEERRATLFPFEEGALRSAMKKAQYYPRGTLLYAYNVLKQAALDAVPAPISLAYVEAFVERHVLKNSEEDTMFSIQGSETNLRG